MINKKLNQLELLNVGFIKINNLGITIPKLSKDVIFSYQITKNNKGLLIKNIILKKSIIFDSKSDKKEFKIISKFDFRNYEKYFKVQYKTSTKTIKQLIKK